MGKLVETYLISKEIRGPSDDELLFVKNNPSSVPLLQSSACAALSISSAVCEVKIEQNDFAKAWDEETDAIRHFIFSALLACARGKTFAEKYTAAHEGPPDKWTKTHEMDIHNNYEGFAWAAPQLGHCLLPNLEQRMTEAAIKSLITEKLVVLEKSKTACKDPRTAFEKIQKMSPDEFRELTETAHFQIKKHFPQLCR